MRTAILTAILIALGACTGAEADHADYRTVAGARWAYGDTLLLTPAASDTAVSTVDIAIAVRHDDNYIYSNLWLEVTIPGADTLRRDTLNVRLADPDGRWLGARSHTGHIVLDTIRAVSYAAPRPVAIRHVMRADTIDGITQLGTIICTDETN